MATRRIDTPPTGDEITLLRSFLNYYRATVRMKAEGLDAAQLATRLGPSDLTLGGLLKHLALVEHSWFRYRVIGGEYAAPWSQADWEADHDWELHSAAQDSPEELFALFDAAIADSEAILDDVLASADGPALDRLIQRDSYRGDRPSLRWVLIHLIEEYARHSGHADLIRESIDGATGD